MNTTQDAITREDAKKILAESRKAFKDVSPEEIEREVARTIKEVREENSQRVRRRKGAPQVERDRPNL